MKRLFIMLCFFGVQQISAQTTTGIISYTSVSTARINMGGQEIQQKMNFALTLSFSGSLFRLAASMQSASSAAGSGIQINGSPQMFQYYDSVDNTSYQLTNINGVNYAIAVEQNKLTDMKKTGKTQTILGYACIEFTCNYNGEAATGWYTPDLPAVVSPVGLLGLPGGLIKLESGKHTYNATDIKLEAVVNRAELVLPAAVIKTTKDGFQKLINN